jgi:hypothetical protein
MKTKQLSLKVKDLEKAEKILLKLSFIQSISKQSSELVLSFEGGQKEKIELSTFCVENKLGLIELKEKELSLEEIFLYSLGEQSV